MGVGGSKEQSTDEENPLKRNPTTRANEDEEKVWMEIMNAQNNSAVVYAKRAQPKKPGSGLMNVKIIFVVGGPGSGKGTHCIRLSQDFNLCHLSVGDLLRDEAQKGSERGTLLNEYMKEGKIVPMEITLEVLKSALQENKGKAGFLIDGFPRKLDQAKEFEEKIAKCSLVLYFDCSEEEMTRRLLIRGQTSGRVDDNEETIKKRLVTFREASMPVIEYFQEFGKVKTVKSEGNVEEIYEEASHILSTNNFNMIDPWSQEKEDEMMERLSRSVSPRKSVTDSLEIPASVIIPSGHKRAVLIGLNYTGANFKKNLGGCIKDVLTMEQALRNHMGYEVLCMTEKTPFLPTSSNVLSALKLTTQGCQEGDDILLYFSGHHAQIKANGGKSHDILFTSDGAIFDFDLAALLDSLPQGVHFTVVIDSCSKSGGDSFSGSLVEVLPRCSFFISTAPSPVTKQMNFHSGGVLTTSLLTALKEQNYSIKTGQLKDIIESSLKNLTVPFVHSLPGDSAKRPFLGFASN